MNMARFLKELFSFFRTGWGKYYGNKKNYTGTDIPGDTAGLSYPGLGVEAAKWIVKNRLVVGIAIEGLSLDVGIQKDLEAHRIVSERNMFIVENMGPNLNKLPPTGAKISLYPMKLEGGSGGPCRVVADISFAITSKSSLILMVLMFAIFYLFV